MSKTLRDSIFSVVYGGILGDIIGLPYEFAKRGRFIATGTMNYAENGYPIGTWSDDTSLTLCLIQNIIEDGDESELLNKFLSYFEKGEYTPYGYAFGIGKTTKNALLKYKLGLSPKECGLRDEKSNGNGSLMRIAPLVFSFRNTSNFAERVELVKKYSEVTHAHPRSILACVIYIETLYLLFNGQDLKESLQNASKHCFENLKNTEYESEFHNYKRILDVSIKDEPIDSIKSSGYVVYSLEAALWSCFHSFSIKDAILTAVNLGGDTDTIGSIAGSIAGMQYKNPISLPSDWLSHIIKKNAIDEMIEQFYQHLIK